MYEAEKVRDMILDPATTAKEMGLAPGYVGQLTQQWLRKLDHRCVLCDKPVKDNELKHPWCKGIVLDPRPARTLLLHLMVDPYSTVAKAKCSKCGFEFEVTVKRAMRAFERGGLHTVDLCESCLLDRMKEPLRWTPFDTASMRDLKKQTKAAKRSARKGGSSGQRKRKCSTGGDVRGPGQGKARERRR